MKHSSKLTQIAARLCAALAGLALLAGSLSAQTANTGAIEGRVENVTRGDYLNKARVAVEGTLLQTLTNEYGEYRLTDVPAGQAKVTVFYSGLAPQTAAVAVAAGQTAVQNFDFKMAAPTTKEGDAVQLDKFVVAETREMAGSAIATNEQRFAPNMKTVLAADEFGDQTEGNVAEFLKLMPGVSIGYVDQDGRNASLRGMPSYAVFVTMNGSQLASASSSNENRNFEFEQISMNNLSRIEITKSMMPDMPADGIGGTINLVPKSAFERSRPQLSYRTYFNFNSTRTELGATPGPGREPIRKVRPGFDLSYVVPVNKRFGFTVSLLDSFKYNPQIYSNMNWNRNINPATGAENPYLGNFFLIDGPKHTTRISGSIGADWRITRHGVLQVGFDEGYYKAMITSKNLVADPGSTPAAFSPTFTQGRDGAGLISLMGNAMRTKTGTTYTPSFRFIHDGPVWKIEANGAYSHASNQYRSIANGHFDRLTVRMGVPNPNGSATPLGPTVRLDNFTPNAPLSITAVNGLGVPVSPYDLSNYLFSGVRQQGPIDSIDVKKTVRLSVKRDFDPGFPLTLKTGVDVVQAIRDIRSVDKTYTYLGPDGKANSADNNAAFLLDESYSTVTTPWGLPKVQWPSAYKAYDIFKAHPEYFTIDEAVALANEAGKSKYQRETSSAAYLRFDARFLHNRLAVAGGARYQRKQTLSQTPDKDATDLYLREADGSLSLDPSGKPIKLNLTTIQTAQRTNVDRGVTTSRKNPGKLYPSFNATYSITENLQLRAAWYKSINYPNLSETLQALTISAPDAPVRTITVNPVELQPWTATNYDLDLEYYTPGGGNITVSWYRKNISNFINNVTYPSATAQQVQQYGLPPALFTGYRLTTKYNGGEAVNTGWEFSLRQNLNTVLPAWGRGFVVFYNTSYKAAPSGVKANDLTAAAIRRMNWGVSFNRWNFGANLKWNHIPEPKFTVPPGTAGEDSNNSKTYLDVDVSYRFRPSLAVFANATNITRVGQDVYFFGPNTPEYARRLFHQVYGIQWVVGVKGTF